MPRVFLDGESSRPLFANAKPRIISDNGPQLIAKDFKEFIRISGMTHVRTSPYYPQSNGKIERWHKSLKGECIRPGTPLSLEDARRLVEGYVEHYDNVRLNSAVGATLWRWLSSDALRPWQHRSWIFPRDPNFADKAGPILDLYKRVWEGTELGPDDYVISADEKTSIQARRRKQPTLPSAPNRPTRVEHEYFRKGAWTYLAAWDVHRARSSAAAKSRAAKSGIAPVDRVVAEVMSQEPYKSARHVFWIMDNCSAHRGQKAATRLRDKWPNAYLIHTPVHASWLNQVEIYFSIVQRKVLTPNDFPSLADLEQRLLAFQGHYERSASPFKWTFTRRDLHDLLAKIAGKRLATAA